MFKVRPCPSVWKQHNGQANLTLVSRHACKEPAAHPHHPRPPQTGLDKVKSHQLLSWSAQAGAGLPQRHAGRCTALWVRFKPTLGGACSSFHLAALPPSPPFRWFRACRASWLAGSSCQMHRCLTREGQPLLSHNIILPLYRKRCTKP